MSYFSDHYGAMAYPVASDGRPGLRKAQIGAIHAIASHFTISDGPALVVLPTGTGKTAVLMMSAFVERAKRVLVVTPSRLLRDQIKAQFEEMLLLRQLGVISQDLPNPKVTEVTSQLKDEASWEALSEYDVIVGTPHSVSPAIQAVADPPRDFFDLLLVDEAHHSPAKTWNELINHFDDAKKILFTATPFRRDGQEVKGDLVYCYPLRKAYEDHIFQEIQYLPINPQDGVSNDAVLARQAEATLRADRAEGYEHFLIVRTDSKKRAGALAQVYSENTALRLEVVHSGFSQRRITETITRLKNGDLDGIICVAMLGEGFDFSNLKIAAIHSPHKSLEVTLQFIGRLVRVGEERLGTAKFLAIPSEIEVERVRLYEEGAVWQDLIRTLGETRMDRERETRECLNRFQTAVDVGEGFADLSLYALQPFYHVKIYQTWTDVEIAQEIQFPLGFEVLYRSNNLDERTAVFVTVEKQQPKWTNAKELEGSRYDLFLIYYDQPSRLLFINASRRNDSLYEELAGQYCAERNKILPLYKINRVLLELDGYEFFNIGMKNRMINSRTESYRIISGSRAQQALSTSDGRLYHRGHVYGRATEAGQPTTIGYSSASKVWSNTCSQIPQFIQWCKHIAGKISSEARVNTNSRLDLLEVGVGITEIPGVVLAAEWDAGAYAKEMSVRFHIGDGQECRRPLLDAEISVIREESTNTRVKTVISWGDYSFACFFTLGEDRFFSSDEQSPLLCSEHENYSLLDYLNANPLNFYTHDFSRIRGSELFGAPEVLPGLFDVHDWDWAGNNVDIEVEVRGGNARVRQGMTTVQEFLENSLIATDFDVVLCDHGNGEVADFIAVKEDVAGLEIDMYHCKSSSEENPGNRVEDIYEVCGQVIKSTAWLNDNVKLCQKLEERGSRVVKGSFDLLKTKLSLPLRTRYRVYLVQPGLSKTNMADRISTVLSSSDDFVKRAGAEGLVLLTSP